MPDFLSTVLPWILMILILAVVFFHFHKRNKVKKPSVQDTPKETIPQDSQAEDSYFSVGMSLGMCFGTMLGAMNVIPLTYGISFGMLIGMVIGMLIKKK